MNLTQEFLNGTYIFTPRAIYLQGIMFLREVPIRSWANCIEQFSNQGNGIEILRFPGTRGSQPGTVNSVTYPFEEELNTKQLMVTQVSLKIKHKQLQGCIYLTVNVKIPQAIKFSHFYPLCDCRGREQASVSLMNDYYLSAMSHLKRTVILSSLGNKVFDWDKRKAAIFYLVKY